jgi:hypothetical protein
MASTVVGNSGRVYMECGVLQERKDPRLSIFKAKYVIKPHNSSFAYPKSF